MRKSELSRLCDDLIEENKKFCSELHTLREELNKYKEILKSTRDCYGYKLMELEQKRLILEHPNVLVDDIEWDLIEDYSEFPNARYKFVYSIKGEKQ